MSLTALAAVPSSAATRDEVLEMLHCVDGTRPPNWRWRVAQWLVDNPRSLNRCPLDDWTKLVMRYLRTRRKLKPGSSQHPLMRRYPGVYAAVQLRHEERKRSLRVMTEAYLCANATFEAIASVTGLNEVTIGCYARIFFDLSGHAENWGYLLSEATGRPIDAKLSPSDLDVLWKVFGTLRGPRFLDFMLRSDTVPGLSHSDAAADAAVSDLHDSGLRIKAMIAARTVPVSYNEEVIFNAAAKIRELKQDAAGSAGASSAAATKGLEAVFNMFQFELAGREALTEEEQVAHAKRLAEEREPRANEQLLKALEFQGGDDGEAAQRE